MSVPIFERFFHFLLFNLVVLANFSRRRRKETSAMGRACLDSPKVMQRLRNN